jgi:RimJ/RimL family protein N-acetyltransferase
MRAMSFPDEVETPRLVLRRWLRDDREALVAIWSDPHVWRALQPGVPFDPGRGERSLEQQLRHWNDHGFGLWAAVDRASEEVAGWVGASHPTFVPELAHHVELGEQDLRVYTLSRPTWTRNHAGGETRSQAPWGRLG